MIGEFDLLLPGKLIRELVLMLEIERDPLISQSALADKAGLVPSMVNTYIRRMGERGLVEKHGDSRRNTSYFLTASGRDHRAELARRYSIETVRLYKYAKGEFRRRLGARADELKHKRIVVYGSAETGELSCQVLIEMGCLLVGVVDSDPSQQGRCVFGHTVLNPQALEAFDPEVVLVGSLGHVAEIESRLTHLASRGVEIITVEMGVTV
jgi:DNA-binding MarR family transcriptional regulator